MLLLAGDGYYLLNCGLVILEVDLIMRARFEVVNVSIPLLSNDYFCYWIISFTLRNSLYLSVLAVCFEITHNSSHPHTYVHGADNSTHSRTEHESSLSTLGLSLRWGYCWRSHYQIRVLAKIWKSSHHRFY